MINPLENDLPVLRVSQRLVCCLSLLACLCTFLLSMPPCQAENGPLGTDHRIHYDNDGPWLRQGQLDVQNGVALTELGGALWLGSDNRLGNTFWRTLDASVLTAISVQGMKHLFGRERPSQTSDSDLWFHGGQSFPSGEVALQASFVTPIIMEYKHDNPWIWTLELLPVYDSIARLRTHGHWQSDVAVGWAVGTLWGIYAHDLNTPLFFDVMPNGVMIGLHTTF